MQRRPFGRSGLHVPILGFGAMQAGDPAVDEAKAARLLNGVVDAGLVLIDTARSYGLAEERIGRHLGHRRDEFVLSTKVGYGVPGVADWTYDCIVQGVDAARARLRTDTIDIVHLHSCGIDTLRADEVVRALARCRELGRIRLAAYSGDGAALQWAVESGAFDSVQASVNLCDQQALPVLRGARERGIGSIAKRSLLGRPWAAAQPPQDAVHREYHRRFAFLRREIDADALDWDALALRFAAYEDGVDCVIVGGTSLQHVHNNREAVARGPLDAALLDAIHNAFARHGLEWRGLV